MTHNTLLRKYFQDAKCEDIVQHWYRLSWLERVDALKPQRSETEGMLLDLPVEE